MLLRHLALFAALGLLPIVAPAAVIGINPPPLPVTASRIAELPPAAQAPWRRYLRHSEQLRQADQASLARELKAAGLAQALPVPERRGAVRRMLWQPATWYATAEARHMADAVVSFQTPAGGWDKNFDPTRTPRRTGQAYGPNNNSRFLSLDDNDRPADPNWNYVGTIDNDATTTELRFLARVAAAADATTGAGWRRAFRRGLAYLCTAQFPNGGWPQVYPLDGGYHDEITFNDDAMTHVLVLLHDVATARPNFAWLTVDDRRRAAAALQRGLQCVLECQIRVHGRQTGWCQQYDALTLVPASARNFEMPALTTRESATIALFLISLRHPSSEVDSAVYAVDRWFQRTAQSNVSWGPAPDGSGRALLPAPGHGPLWPRFLQIGTDRPIFGDRDKTIHDRVDELSKERRNGYGWYLDTPQRALAAFGRWSAAHPR